MKQEFTFTLKDRKEDISVTPDHGEKLTVKRPRNKGLVAVYDEGGKIAEFNEELVLYWVSREVN